MGGKLRLGLFGGSFDPVHLGHIALAAAAWREFKLDRVVFIPARRPPHKRTKALASPARRVKMLSLALRPYPQFRISLFELKRRSTTYTYQTVNHFRRRYPGAEIFFILGSDSLAELGTWKRADVLASRCCLIAGRRKGVPGKTGARRPCPAAMIRRPLPPISSSEIRNKVKNGESITGLVPPAVERYIRRTGLYRT